jgi:hypothetical protein
MTLNQQAGAEAWPWIRTHLYDSDANVSVTGTDTQSDRKHGSDAHSHVTFHPTSLSSNLVELTTFVYVGLEL